MCYTGPGITRSGLEEGERGSASQNCVTWALLAAREARKVTAGVSNHRRRWLGPGNGSLVGQATISDTINITQCHCCQPSTSGI